MKRFALLLTLFLVTARPAQAEFTLTVTKICQEISAVHDGSGAQYVPGVDVHGKPVASANIDGAPALGLNQPIVIPIELDLLERFGIEAPAGIEMKSNMAQVIIEPDGTVTFNGQEITQRAAFVCAEERMKARGLRSNVTIKGMRVQPDPAPVVDNKRAGDGQKRDDAIHIEPVPVVPPIEPIWNDDKVLTGQGH